MTILLLLALDAGIPLIVLALLLILRKEKYVWAVPAAVIIGNAIYAAGSIISLYGDLPLNEKIRLYFVNDSSMGLYLIHIPMVLLSALFTMCFVLARRHEK